MPPKTVAVDSFNIYLTEALKDQQVIDAINKLIDRQALLNAIDLENSALVTALRKDIKDRDETIKLLSTDVAELKKQVDDLEQYSRKIICGLTAYLNQMGKIRM